MQWHNTFLPPKLLFISNEELQQYNSSSTLIPVLTSLEEEAVPRYIQFAGHPAQGGRNSSWNQVKSTDGEFINARYMSNWARSESHWVQLSIGELIWLTPQPIHWSIHQNSSRWAKTCWERGRVKLPIKNAKDQLWIWFDHLLQSRICQIQSICFRSNWFHSNQLRIHWFMI